jgi:thiol-disulfide isomerase/thioredoxin
MAEITELKGLDDSDTCDLLEMKLLGPPEGEFALVLYHGNDWCHDCLPAVEGLERLSKKYDGPVQLYSAYVGTKKEWEKRDSGKNRTNAFMQGFSHLQELPTIALYKVRWNGPMELAKIILPDSNNPMSHVDVMKYILNSVVRY